MKVDTLCLELANPAQKDVILPPTNYLPGLQLLRSSTGDDEEGSTVFGYHTQLSEFDRGVLIVLEYLFQEEDPSCYENSVIQDNEPFTPPGFETEVLPQILPYVDDSFFHVVCFSVATVSGKFRVTYVSQFAPQYPLVPPCQAILPTVSIAEMKKDTTLCVHRTVAPVSFKGDRYAFKHHGPPEARHEERPIDSLFQELTCLLAFRDCSSIVAPTHIVLDATGERFRGFLTPWHSAGTLSDILSKRHEQSFDNRPHLGPEARIDPSFRSKAFLPWGLKVRWAIDMAQGLVDLHTIGVPCGDIKLENMVLCRDGHVRLIDAAPQKGWTHPYLSPEWSPFVDVQLTGPRDVFAMGLSLWCLSEEVYTFERDPREDPVLLWQTEYAPSWYQELVTRCVTRLPEDRPTAEEILSTLRTQSDPL